MFITFAFDVLVLVSICYLTYESASLSLDTLSVWSTDLEIPLPSRQLQFGSRYPVIAVVPSRYLVRYRGPVPVPVYLLLYIWFTLSLLTLCDWDQRPALVTSMIEDLASCDRHLACFRSLGYPTCFILLICFPDKWFISFMKVII